MPDLDVHISGQDSFPSQRRRLSKKSRKWAKECIDAAEDIALYQQQGIRKSHYNKVKNYQLANGILDENDIEHVMNPYQIEGATFPAKMQNYPIANPKIELLVGEEWKRPFDYTVRIANHDAISRKEEEKKDKWADKIQELIRRDDIDEDQIRSELHGFKRYLDYEFQDIRERRANQLVAHHEKEQRFDLIFNRGFRDALIAGEQIYRMDIVGGAPVMRKSDPLNLHTVRSGDSPYIEESDIIIEDDYKSPGQVIDDYHDELSPDEINALESGKSTHGDQAGVGEKEPDLVLPGGVWPEASAGSDVIGTGHNGAELLNVSRYGEVLFGGAFDGRGNIRVLRVCWKSMRLVKYLKYFDELGDEQYDYVHEEYEPNTSAGEEIVDETWISEWWEGTRIGRDIYVKVQPRPVQFRKLDNPSICYPGYVGTAFNINSSEAVSLMDRMKPYQYIYNVLMYNLELAVAKSKGKIAQLDLSKIPAGWDPKKWLYYADHMGVAIVDSFKEGTKGRSRGQLAGNVNNTLGNNVLNLEMGQYIQQLVSMLQYIEQQLGNISGVSEQRQGQIQQRELVGNVERAVTQSSHITEDWFKVHEDTKKRALEAFIETAKEAYRGRSEKAQYIMDDASTAMYDIDGDQFADQEYGVFVSNATEDKQLRSMIEQLAQAGIQNDKIDFSQLVDIYKSGSIASMTKKLQRAEREKAQQQERVQQQQLKEQRAQRQADQQEKQADRALEQQKLQQEAQQKTEDRHSKELIEQLKLREEQEQNDQEKQISMEELKQQRDELEAQMRQKREELEQQDEHHEDEISLKQKEQELKEKELEIQRRENRENK